MSQHVARYKVFIRLFIIVALTLIAILAWFSFMNADRTPTATENSRALIGGHFELVNQLGKPVTEKDFLGKYMLVYFGYTYCPDVCPMDLQIMADAFNDLTPEQQDKINLVFVTVDPERDTVETMAEYVSFFSEKLIGLTGTVEQINNIKKAYRVYAAKADDSPDYLVDHTAYTYLMDKDGTFLQHFNHGENAEEMAVKIASFMNK